MIVSNLSTSWRYYIKEIEKCIFRCVCVGGGGGGGGGEEINRTTVFGVGGGNKPAHILG